MYWLPNWTCGALHCFRWPLACALQQPQCCVPPLSPERVSHCLLQMHWGAAAAMKQVHAFPCKDFIFILGHGSLAPKAWFCPQAPCCVARLSGDLSDSNRDLGLQPRKGYSCCEKGWWNGCTGCTLPLTILCRSPFCFAVSNVFEQDHGRIFCSLAGCGSGVAGKLVG